MVGLHLIVCRVSTPHPGTLWAKASPVASIELLCRDGQNHTIIYFFHRIGLGNAEMGCLLPGGLGYVWEMKAFGGEGYIWGWGLKTHASVMR